MPRAVGLAVQESSFVLRLVVVCFALHTQGKVRMVRWSHCSDALKGIPIPINALL